MPRTLLRSRTFTAYQDYTNAELKQIPVLPQEVAWNRAQYIDPERKVYRHGYMEAGPDNWYVLKLRWTISSGIGWLVQNLSAWERRAFHRTLM